jgi:hypothetical protein
MPDLWVQTTVWLFILWLEHPGYVLEKLDQE